jgi:hypothetical protein
MNNKCKNQIIGEEAGEKYGFYRFVHAASF